MKPIEEMSKQFTPSESEEFNNLFDETFKDIWFDEKFSHCDVTFGGYIALCYEFYKAGYKKGNEKE